MAILLGAVTAAGCDGGAETQGGGAEPEIVEVRFTREDGSLARFPDTVRAWCGPFDSDNPAIESVHVLAGKLPSSEAREPVWVLTAVRADVERDPTTTLPNNFVYTEPRGAAFFALDDEEHRSNELSSLDDEAAGTIHVRLTGCEPGDTVRLKFDGVRLGGETLEGPWIAVEGTVVARIGAAP